MKKEVNKEEKELIEEIKKTSVFPQLIKQDTKGKTRFWSIEVKKEGDKLAKIITNNGIIGGKEKKPHIVDVVGKKDTTAFTQAMMESIKKFKDKLNSDFHVKGIEKPKTFFPMLMKHRYEVNANKRIGFPCVIQDKKDGCRGIGIYRKDREVASNEYYKGPVILQSRDGMKIISAPQINKELEQLFDSMPTGETDGVAFDKSKMYIDGELYKKGESYSKISGDIKSLYKIESSELEFHIFDIYFETHKRISYRARYKLLEMKIVPEFKYLKLVQNIPCPNEEFLLSETKKIVEAGGEGVVIRDMNGVYEPANNKSGPRSNTLHKFKLMQTEYYKIISVNGVKKGNSYILTIRVFSKYGEFNITGDGTAEYKELFAKEKSQNIGQFIKVQFYEKAESGKPRKPVTCMTDKGYYITKPDDKNTTIVVPKKEENPVIEEGDEENDGEVVDEDDEPKDSDEE